MSTNTINKIFLAFFCFSILIASVSALNFDNSKSYNESSKTATIKNAFGLGSEIATAKLDTPHYNIVGVGDDVKIAEFTINADQDYNNFFQGVDFYNLGNLNKKISKSFTYKVKTIQGFDLVNRYGSDCKTLQYKNGSNYQQCNQIIDGQDSIPHIVWTSLSDLDIKQGSYTIGIFISTKEGEKGEWIPKIAGQSINEWASYEATNLKYVGSNNLTATINSMGDVHNAYAFTANYTGRIKVVQAYFTNGTSTIQNRSVALFSSNGTSPIARISSWSDVQDLYFSNLTVPINWTIPDDTALITNGQSYFIVFNLTKYVQGFTRFGSEESAGLPSPIYFFNNSGLADTGTQWLQFNPSSFKELNIRLWGGVNTDIALVVNLLTPVNDTNLTSSNLNFTSSLIGTIGTNITNATLLVWKQDGTLFSSQTNSLPGNSSVGTNFSVSGLQAGRYKWNVFGCGINSTATLCNMSQSNFTFSEVPLITNVSFNNLTTEGSTETFTLNVTIPEANTIASASLIYNSSSYSSTIISNGANNYSLRNTIAVPSVDTSKLFGFSWNITFDNGFSFQSLNYSQNVTSISIDNCTAFTNKILNFTVVDERLQTFLPNATLETALNLYSNDRSLLIVNISNFYSNPLSLCISTSLLNNTSYLLDVIVRYQDVGQGANEYYNIVNQTLTNSTPRQGITLYDLNLSESTDFQITFTGSDYLPVAGALIYVDRQYIAENQFKTVELPLTDSNGQTVVHLVRNDVIYNFRVVKNGVVLGNFERVTAFCQDFTIGACSINLAAQNSTEPIFDYNKALGITYQGPTYNNNSGNVDFTYSSFTGNAKLVRMDILKDSTFGNRTICTNSVTSPGATLSCNIGSSDATKLRANIYVDGKLTVSKILATSTSNSGEMGYLFLFMFALTVILMFSGSKTGILIGILISFAGAVGLHAIDDNVIGVGASGLWLIIIVIIGIWKLNKDNPQ